MESGATQDRLARTCHRLGIEEYSGSRIAQIESGAMAPTVTALAALAMALGEVLGRRLTLADLIPDGDSFQAGRRLNFTGEEVRAFVNGAAVFAPPPIAADPTHMRGWGSADELAVSSLKVSPEHVHKAAEALWGAEETLTRERDRRSGPRATAQKRGRVTRELIAEVRAELNSAGDPQ